VIPIACHLKQTDALTAAIFFPCLFGGGNAQTHTTEHTDTSPKTVPGRRSFLTLQVRSSAQTRGLWLNDRQAEKRCGLLIEWRSRSVNGVLLASGHHTTRIPWRGGGTPVAGRRSPRSPFCARRWMGLQWPPGGPHSVLELDVISASPLWRQ